MQRKDEYLSIDSMSGTVCIQKRFDFEKESSYQTTVVATNSNSETSTSLISIRLKDVNDNWPVFYPNEYHLTIREGPKPSEPLLVVSASDLDSGQFGEISYQILSESSLFSINSMTGEVFAKKDLTLGRFHLVVTAKDGGGQSSENPANIHITVIDRTTKTPEFSRSKYEIKTTEDILPGIAIGSVAAISEGRIRYSIYSGDPDHSFSIDEATGKIYVTRYLDADVHDTVLLNIQATMEGGMSNQTQVLISIDDHNDNAPIFSNGLVEISIREDTIPRDPFYVVKAIDKDKKKNGEVKYSIISSHPGSSIEIDPFSGQLSSSSEFDYESIRSYKLRIKAQDLGIPPRSSNMTLFVHITDVNDNSPKFDKSSYFMEIQENSPPKSVVGRVGASDLDSQEAGQVSYRITNGSEYFGIDEKLGTIYTKKSLDRETISHIDVSIVAEDKGTPPRTSSVQARITVLDTNDNPPSCLSITPIVVPSGSPISTSIGTIVAGDPDKGLNGSVLYRAQLQSNLFLVKANGDVYLRRPLNASDDQHQRLSVIVSDQGTPRKSVVCHVSIRIAQGSSDIVLKEPIQRYLEIPPGCEGKCRLAEFNASGVVTWQIQSSEVSNHFAIREGVLSMVSLPTHRPPYSLVIVLSDRNDRQKTIQLRIVATGQENELLRIPDTSSIGTKIGRLGEKDASLFYKPQNGSCPLELDQTGGVLYLAEGVRGKENNFSCFFEKFNTTDGSVDEMRVDLEVSRSKSDRPQFDTQHLTVHIREDTPTGSIITTVNATANDDSSTPISYRFPSQIDSFAVDQFTGDISLVEPLHWHVKSKYHLIVEAFTTGTGTTLLVTVEVEDINDHSPFIVSQPTVLLPSSFRKGDIVHRVVGIDMDQNPMISYSIQNYSEPVEALRINNETGEITVVGGTPLPETITVRAEDAEDPTKYDEQKVLIKTFNTSRQHWHHFENQKDTVVLPRGTPKDTVVMEYPEGARLKLIPGSPHFELKGSTVILTSIPPPGTHRFTVVAQKEEDLLDWTTLEITVPPVVTDPPKISSTSCGVVTVEENVSLKDFKRIMATGMTEKSRFRFQGTSTPFSIDPETGYISTSPLDREAAQEHLLVVILQDSGRNDSCTVRVTVADQNDNKPVFMEVPQEITVNESSQIGDVLWRLSASDMDIGLNGKLSFELLEDPSRSLDVVPETGALVLRRKPSKSQWKIRIRVIDHGSPRLEAEREIDMLSHAPDTLPTPLEFSRQTYLSTIDEGLPRGQFVSKLETSEEVSGITYSIIEGNLDSAFSIDQNGVVRTNVELDKEIVERYNLKVIGLVPKGSQVTTRLDVRVSNLNDNVPSFPGIKPRRVAENLRVGSYVATVTARDVDGLGLLQYSILDQGAFEIDRFTGVIHLKEGLDFEKEKEHTIRLRVTDGSFDSYANLTGKLTYSLSPDSSSIFRISDGGALSMKVLPPSGERYLITVTASDDGIPSLSTSVPVSVVIGEVAPTEKPVFERQELRFEIQENSKIGLQIGNLSGETREFLYRIPDPEASKIFSVDQFGRLFVAGPIDRETKEFWEFHVEIDNEMVVGQKTSCKCHVAVLDENDNSPEFESTVFPMSLKDSMVHGQTIGQVSARDADAEENGRVSYRILSGNDLNIVTVNPDTGSVQLNEWNDDQLVQYPQGSWYILVEARDHGHPYRSSIARIQMSLKMSSWSGSAPFFVLPVYEIHVMEDTPIGTMIQRVRASNRLGVENKGLLYSLKEHQGKLSIDVKTGEITLKTHLDWESEPLLSMYLSVSDGNGRSAVVPLKILVEPVDEFSPVFTKSSYTLQIPISTSAGESVGQMQAIDEDGGVHGVVKYRIPDRQSTVSIEENTGIIRLSKSLSSRRNLTIEQITVIAYSSPSRTTKTTVYLEIGPFDVQPTLPKLLLHSKPVQIAAASLILLLLLLIVVICVCMCKTRRKEKKKEGIRREEDRKPSIPKPILQKQVYSVKTGEIRTLSGDIHHQPTHSMTSSVSTSSDPLRMVRGSSRSQMDSGIDPDNVSINSSVTDYLVSLGVNANPIPPRIRPNTTYDSLMNEYIYARVEDVLPPGPISLTTPNQHSLLRQPLSTASRRTVPIVPSFEPLTEIFNEIVEMRKKNDEGQRKEYVQVEI
uniref:Cadherin domain-containing protein n=1 Tax=Caenorhabditis tropicalis TaxID=1561998 RepID=A0A1I7UPC8_9PELO